MQNGNWEEEVEVEVPLVVDESVCPEVQFQDAVDGKEQLSTDSSSSSSGSSDMVDERLACGRPLNAGYTKFAEEPVSMFRNFA